MPLQHLSNEPNTTYHRSTFRMPDPKIGVGQKNVFFSPRFDAAEESQAYRREANFSLF